MVKISDTNTEDYTFDRTVERESELISIIESYIKLGKAVKKPLMIRCSDGYGQQEVTDYLAEKYNGLSVDGHPLKQGHRYFDNNGKIELVSQHPELTSTFLTPSCYNSENPPQFFIHKTYGYDNSWNPSYYLECVERLKIPFVYFAPTQWMAGDFDNPQGRTLEGPNVLLEFDSVLYAPTVKGWVEEMADDAELPAQKRIIKTAINPRCQIDVIDYESLDIVYDIASKTNPEVLKPRIQNLINYAESIKDLDSYDNLYDPDFMGLFNVCKTGAGIPYLLERVMDFYSTMFYFRAIWPDNTQSKIEYKNDLGSLSIHNLGVSFMKFIETTDDAWVFDYSKPVPEDILQEIKRITS